MQHRRIYSHASICNFRRLREESGFRRRYFEKKFREQFGHRPWPDVLTSNGCSDMCNYPYDSVQTLQATVTSSISISSSGSVLVSFSAKIFSWFAEWRSFFAERLAANPPLLVFLWHLATSPSCPIPPSGCRGALCTVGYLWKFLECCCLGHLEPLCCV